MGGDGEPHAARSAARSRTWYSRHGSCAATVCADVGHDPSTSFKEKYSLAGPRTAAGGPRTWQAGVISLSSRLIISTQRPGPCVRGRPSRRCPILLRRALNRSMNHIPPFILHHSGTPWMQHQQVRSFCLQLLVWCRFIGRFVARPRHKQTFRSGSRPMFRMAVILLLQLHWSRIVWGSHQAVGQPRARPAVSSEIFWIRTGGSTLITEHRIQPA